MKRLPLLLTIFSLGVLSILTACTDGSTSGYSRGGVWDYSAPAPKAEEKPNQLAIEDLDESLTEEEAAIKSQGEGQASQAMIAGRPDLPPVKIALLLPLSGQNEKLGEAMLNASQIALFDIGHNNFEIMPFDTRGTPAGAQIAAQQALQNKSQLVLGPVFAGAAAAAKPILNGAGVPMIAFTTDWTLAGSGTYIMGFMPFDQVERVVRYSAAKGYTDMGVITGTDDYSDVVSKAYRQYAGETGIRTVASERISPQSSSLSNVVRNFAQYDNRNGQNVPPPFQAIFMPLGGDNARAVSTLAAQYDLPPTKVRRIGTGLWDDASLATEPSMNGAWFAAPSPDSRKDFMRRYFDTYGVSPPRLATLSYDATALVAVLARNGLSQGRGPDFGPSSLTNPNGFAGIDGIFRFRQTGLVERGLAVLEYKHGNIIVRDPAPRTFQSRGF